MISVKEAQLATAQVREQGTPEQRARFAEWFFNVEVLLDAAVRKAVSEGRYSTTVDAVSLDGQKRVGAPWTQLLRDALPDYGVALTVVRAPQAEFATTGQVRISLTWKPAGTEPESEPELEPEPKPL